MVNKTRQRGKNLDGSYSYAVISTAFRIMSPRTVFPVKCIKHKKNIVYKLIYLFFITPTIE